MKILMFLLLLSLCGPALAQTTGIQGKVFAEGEPVAFASVYIENSNTGTTTNEKGEFQIDILPGKKNILVISSIGFKTYRKELSAGIANEKVLTIVLTPARDELEEVLIVDQQTGLTRRTPYNVTSISMANIEQKGNPSGIMGIVRELPGVYGAEFGQGIVKPFIRGLGFSRIVTIYQGNKLENHQWGADHGLGVNDLGIQKIEVIKGPASVLYGSGALGGVILAKDEENYLHSTRLTGNIGTTYNSVSNGLRSYASLGKSFENEFFIAADLAYESHADYKNGENRIIGNSRFNTRTLRLHTGIEKANFQNKLSFSYNKQNLGIISDQEMDNSQSLATTRGDRSMQLPFQEVDDYLLSYNQNTKGKNIETSLHLSHHFNNRKEIEESFSLLDLGLKQNHSFYNARLSFPAAGKMKHNIGIQGSILENKNHEEAQDFLIPDALSFENGIYYLTSLELNEWYFQGALRYDLRRVTADATADYLKDDDFILPGDPQNRKLTRRFGGFTGSLGASHDLNENNALKLNLSTGYRAPDLAELFSNGPHPGTTRFEKGNENFEREQSLQADFSYTFSNKIFRASASVYGSRVNNYIFFTATNQVTSEEDLEVWAYRQTNANFYGLEFELNRNWFLEKRLETTLSGALVRARSIETREHLTFIPPDNYTAEVGYYGLRNKSLHLFSKFRFINQQNRTGENEAPTAGYSLLNLGMSKEFSLNTRSFHAAITVYNALNRTYVDHMSILRAFNISSPGRNIMLNLKYNF